mgnify:CR=1 FL=1
MALRTGDERPPLVMAVEHVARCLLEAHSAEDESGQPVCDVEEAVEDRAAHALGQKFAVEEGRDPQTAFEEGLLRAAQGPVVAATPRVGFGRSSCI